MNYYNEFDPYAAQWLRNLIDAGHIARGEVDTRSIKDVRASDLTGFVQCHFFAGLGGWSHALRLARWPEDRPVWTGSCPCQPFSAAGTQKGTADDRHLWPVWFNLIRECRPESSLVSKLKQRLTTDGSILFNLIWKAKATPAGRQVYRLRASGRRTLDKGRLWFVADADSGRHDGRATATGRQAGASTGIASGSAFDQLGDSDDTRSQGRGVSSANNGGGGSSEQSSRTASATNGFWQAADWLPCRDGKARPVEPGTFPLAHGVSARVGRLRAYGNAIVPQVAQVFIEAYLES
jgi:DNA (cytosine-5)-methyltransferase 1